MGEVSIPLWPHETEDYSGEAGDWFDQAVTVATGLLFVTVWEVCDGHILSAASQLMAHV